MQDDPFAVALFAAGFCFGLALGLWMFNARISIRVLVPLSQDEEPPESLIFRRTLEDEPAKDGAKEKQDGTAEPVPLAKSKEVH